MTSPKTTVVTNDEVVTTPQEPAKPVKLPRVKSCGQLAEYGLGEAGCKRLPRHHGDHRVTLHRPKVAKAAKAKASPKATKVTRAEFLQELAAQVDAGTLTPSAALSKASAFITRSKTARRPKASRVVSPKLEVVVDG